MLSEFELIRRYFSPSTRHTLLAGGDDAALVTVAAGQALAVSADMLVSGRHFFADADAAGVGHKSLAVNLSDMAAMG
ncbi:MAG: thiamine-phosphate kinase, partial [Burkholderiales bacterium]|nr:thiamine-phosphate kinase [Burkholderiales bacterium]